MEKFLKIVFAAFLTLLMSACTSGFSANSPAATTTSQLQNAIPSTLADPSAAASVIPDFSNLRLEFFQSVGAGPTLVEVQATVRHHSGDTQAFEVYGGADGLNITQLAYLNAVLRGSDTVGLVSLTINDATTGQEMNKGKCTTDANGVALCGVGFNVMMGQSDPGVIQFQTSCTNGTVNAPNAGTYLINGKYSDGSSKQSSIVFPDPCSTNSFVSRDLGVKDRKIASVANESADKNYWFVLAEFLAALMVVLILRFFLKNANSL